jgi:CheY-like chemotaxis protein
MLLNSSEVLLEIINNILDFSKIEAGKMELDVAPFSIIETVEGLMQTFAQRAGAKGIELILDLSPDLPTQIPGDKTRIRQVLMNLIGNAIKFTEAGEIVVHCTVHTQAQHQRLRCMITDTGIGIPEDLADRLFQSFSQLDASTTRKFGGSGLGLVICKRLVTMMGGEIGYTRNTDKGTTFWFTLPLKAMVSDKPEVPDVLRQLRILVVDDNTTCCAALTEQLTAWGCQAVSITNAYLAPKLLQNAMKEDNPFTLVLLDETMPGIDCSSLLSRIRTSTHFPCPAIILMRSIGRENPDSVEKLPSLPVLFKPIGPVALRMAILATSEPQNMHEQHARREQNYHPRKIGTILVAEDNTVNQIVIHDTLQRFGHHCDIVQNGQQAVEAVQQHHYDVIISSIDQVTGSNEFFLPTLMIVLMKYDILFKMYSRDNCAYYYLSFLTKSMSQFARLFLI